MPNLTRSPTSPPPRGTLETSTTATERPPQALQDKREIEQVTIEFDKKLLDLQNEFKRQMHALQSLLASNNREIQSSVIDLRNEVRRIDQPQISNTSRSVNLPNVDNVRTSHPEPPSSESIASSQQHITHRQKKIYPLPKFSGLPEDWQTFSEAFRSTTDEFEYSDLHNIMRFRDAIEGNAREMVESLLCSSRNVNAIFEILEETYGRPEQLIKSQIQKVHALPAVAEGDLLGLTIFANKISNMTTFLESAQGNHHLTNPTLLSELISKLPVSRQIQWAEKCIQLQRVATVVDFSKWLCDLRKIANMVSDSLHLNSPPIRSNTRKHLPTAQAADRNRGRKYAMVSVVQNKCLCCDGDCESIETCTRFRNLTVNERWQRVKSLRVCFSCLKSGHQANRCFNKRRCDATGCSRFHNRLLHSYTNESQVPEPTSTASSGSDVCQGRRNCHANANQDNDTVLFQIIPIKLYGKKCLTTYAFVDDGANVTMIDAELARELGVQGNKEFLDLQWLNHHTSREQTEVIEISISGVYENATKYKMSNVFVTSNLALPTQSLRFTELSDQDKNVHLKKLPVFSYNNVQPKMIISLTHAYLTVPIESPRTANVPGPIATKTRLGWIVYGPLGNDLQTRHRRACTAIKTDCKNETLEQIMNEYFNAETFGVKAEVKPLFSDADRRALEILNSTTKRRGDRFECGLLWRKNEVTFPESFQMALHRLESIEKKMNRDPEYAAQYQKKIEEYVSKGYARRLSEKEAQTITEKTFYLPHFCVKNPNKKGLRLVFDAAAETHNVSLNKCLLPGPDINQPLISILFQFREAPIAVCGDIKEMFHQILISKNDQDCQRFLWRNGNPKQPLETFIMERMIFGANCSPTIAQHIKNVNAKRFEAKHPRAVKGIVERHYVDDYVDCFQSEAEAIDVVKTVIKIHKAGGFEMRNIVSNSELLQREVGSAAADKSVSVNGANMERVLGMYWSPKRDVFFFDFKFNKVPNDILTFKRKPTKREMLSATMSVFDPFGLLANFTVGAKIIMQTVWKAGIEWDEELPDKIYNKWKNWLEELSKVEQFNIQRCYFSKLQVDDVDLHVFCDASEEAMAAVAYWRGVKAGVVRLSFVAGKTSCAPTRFHTIPKLELQAAVMAVRLKDSIIKYNNISVRNCLFWTDSHTVIRWIRSDHRNYKQFVANRVAEILDSTSIDDWRWCPGELNPADDATRAKFPLKYNPESRWKNGPDFLVKDEKHWPDESFMKNNIDKSSDELRSKHFALLICHVSKTIAPDVNNFSDFLRYKRSMAWTLRFIYNMKQILTRGVKRSGELSMQEQNDAEIYILKLAQQEAFSAEICCLLNNRNIPKGSRLQTLNPLLDDQGILRVYGRIQNATCIPLNMRRPIILPRDHLVTRLIVKGYHRKFGHANTSTVINEVRQRFWVPSIRSLVRNVEVRCTFCKFRKAKPIQPQMGQLPFDRVTPYVRPFSYTGLDFFGPILVTIGRQRQKRWVALFTCLTVRAVHLEIATDLSSDSCLLCIRNFINRRGVPIHIRSDNGTNFVGLKKELLGIKDFLDQDHVIAGQSALGIKWIFNTPADPSAGGAWERLVQSVKRVLFVMLKEFAPRLETFYSLLLEAENIVNSRPLTHLPVTIDDPEPLTPNHFLLGTTNSTQTPAPFEPRLLCLRKQWRILQNLKNCF